MVKEIKTSEQIESLLDIIKNIFEVDNKKDWNKLYEPIQFMKKQKMKLVNPKKFEKEIDNLDNSP